MTTRITLWRELFAEHPRILLKNNDFTVTAFRYASGVEGLKVENSRGHLVILPWMGQMIWDAQFDGHDLTMRNMFSQPKPVGGSGGDLRLFCLPTQVCWQMAAHHQRIHIL